MALEPARLVLRDPNHDTYAHLGAPALLVRVKPCMAELVDVVLTLLVLAVWNNSASAFFRTPEDCLHRASRVGFFSVLTLLDPTEVPPRVVRLVVAGGHRPDALVHQGREIEVPADGRIP